MADDARCPYCVNRVDRKQAFISGDTEEGIVSLIAWPKDLLDNVPYVHRGRARRFLTRTEVDKMVGHASADGPWLVGMAFCDGGYYCGGFAIDISNCPFCGRDLRGEGA